MNPYFRNLTRLKREKIGPTLAAIDNLRSVNTGFDIFEYVLTTDYAPDG